MRVELPQPLYYAPDVNVAVYDYDPGVFDADDDTGRFALVPVAFINLAIISACCCNCNFSSLISDCFISAASLCSHSSSPSGTTVGDLLVFPLLDILLNSDSVPF